MSSTLSDPHAKLNSRYKISRVLGEGGYSVVKLGTCIETGKVVAVKIESKKGMSEEEKSSLVKEVEIMSSLDYKHIVKLIEFFDEPDFFYIVLEYIDGGELFDRIVEKSFYNEKEARDTARILLSTLKFCHDQDIVHRDLKPENLLLTSRDDDADIKLADFGFAAKTNGSTLTEMCGTPGYLAPECIKRQHYGVSVDMWSFGVILYILLGGYPPFHNEDQSMLYKQICAGVFEFHEDCWGSVSQQAKDMISGLLTVDVVKRLTVDQALAHPWMQQDSTVLAATNLGGAQAGIKKYQATKKLKAGVKAVMAINKMKKALFSTASLKLPHNLAARYEIGQKIGEGGFSIVKLGTSVIDGSKTAVKIMKKSGMTKEEKDALEVELDILRSVKQKNIVKLLDFFDEPEEYNIVMEYVDGGELFDRVVDKSYYTEKEARDAVLECLRAIKYLHDNNIVHRDLKPENLLLVSKNDDADLKLCDFGFAARVPADGGNVLTEQCGTPGYIAPEILQGIPYGKQVDMWSFGVIVYILMGGYPPFQNDNKLKLMQSILRAEYEFHPDCWEEVSEDAKDFIRSLLTLDPRQRLTADQALAHKWLMMDGEELTKHGLETQRAALRKYQKLKKLRAGVRTVMAVNFMKKLITPKPSLQNVTEAAEKQQQRLTLDESWELGRVLGEGGYSVVKEGKHRSTGKIAAVKLMKKAGMSAEEMQALHLEVDVLKQLKHKNIVQMLDSFDEPEYYSIVLEYVDGGELFDRVVQKTFYNEKEARDAVLEGLSALNYMHGLGIVHRDIKPENLLLTSKDDDADLKLCDFGFAVKAATDDALSEQCGTPGYMAPEILMGVNYGKGVDIWSFGVVMYILLGGYPPFHDEDKKRLARTIIAGVFEFHEEYWGTVSAEAKDLIRGMLTVDPQKRLTVQQCLEHPWLGLDAATLAARNLESNQAALKKYQALKRMKAGVKAVMAVNKIKKLGAMLRGAAATIDAENAAGTAAETSVSTSSAASTEDVNLEFDK